MTVYSLKIWKKLALFFHRLKNAKKVLIFKEKACFYQFIINNPHYNSYIIYIYLNIKEKIQNLEKNFFRTKSLPLNYHLSGQALAKRLPLNYANLIPNIEQAKSKNETRGRLLTLIS